MIVAERLLHTLFVVAVAGTAVPLVLPGVHVGGRWPERTLRIAVGLGLLGLVVRTIGAGHLPIFGTLENTWTCATAVVIGAAAGQAGGGVVGVHWKLLPPAALVIALWGLKGRFQSVPLTISEQSTWVDLHVLLAWVAFVVLLWASLIAVNQLVSHRRDRDYDPDAQSAVARLVMIGYVFLTSMIAAGAWYLFVLFGTFWRWEVVGVSALVSWVGYSMVIHAWLMQGWRGRRFFAAVLALAVPLLLLYWVWSLFPGTYHFFDIPLLMQS